MQTTSNPTDSNNHVQTQNQRGFIQEEKNTQYQSKITSLQPLKNGTTVSALETANMSANDLQNLLSSFISSTDSKKHQQLHLEKNSSQFYIRDKNGIQVVSEVGGEFKLISEMKDFLVFSKQGEKMVVGTSQVLELYFNDILQSKYLGNSIQIVEFSPDDNFIVLVDKQENTSRCIILDSLNFIEVFNLQIGRFAKAQWPFIRFDSTNSLCFVYNQKDILVFETANFTEVNRYAGGTTAGSFSLSGPREQLFMTLVEVRQALQQQNQPSQFLVWKYDDPTKPYINTELCAAQEVTQLWSNDGKVLLVWTQLLDDESNQSYYGVHHLYHVDLGPGKEIKEIQLFDGPIHDLSWNATRFRYFLVISGYMPAGSVLFNRQGIQLYLISQHHVNTINWSPCGQLVCLSGFGNLPGEMEIWNIQELQLIGQCRKDKVIQFQWSPDSKFFSVATTFPRLRVNNMFQIYSVQGKLIYEQQFAELYEVQWKPNVAKIKVSDKLLQILSNIENPSENQQKKTMTFKKANFIKELKGEHEDQRCPRKLQPDDKLTSFQVQKAVATKRKISSEQTEKGEVIQMVPQPKPQPQMIIRRQVPLEQTLQQVENYQQNQLGEQVQQKKKVKAPKKNKNPNEQAKKESSLPKEELLNQQQPQPFHNSNCDLIK